MTDPGVMKKMWNQRAAEDPFFYVETAFWDGDVDAFFALGEERAKLVVDPVIASSAVPASDMTSLEIGCGLGRFSRPLATRFRRVVAVDVSDEMVRQARELSPLLEYPNLDFRATDGESLTLIETGAIDFVFSYEVFQHMPSYDVIAGNFREIARVLTPTGIALIHLGTKSPSRRGNVVKGVRNTAKSAATRVLPRTTSRVFGMRRFTSDRTWTGSSLSSDEIHDLCRSTGLRMSALRDDPTHGPGERVFVVASPA